MTAIMSSDRRRSDDHLRYTNVAIILHWVIAALIVYNLASGLLKPVLPRGFFVFHISSGITVLVLSIARVLWRLAHRPPAFLPMKEWESRLAYTIHVLLYVAMLALPFSGWALVSAHPPAGSPGATWAAQHATPAPPSPDNKPPAPEAATAANDAKGGSMAPRKRGPVMVWGFFKLPLIGPLQEIGREPTGAAQQKELHGRIESAHLLGGWIMLALLILHVSGALKHQLLDRRRELVRMGLGRPSSV